MRVLPSISFYTIYSACVVRPSNQPTNRTTNERRKEKIMMKTFPILCFAFVWVYFDFFFSMRQCNAIVSTCAFVVTVCTPLRRFTRVHRRSENIKKKETLFFSSVSFSAVLCCAFHSIGVSVVNPSARFLSFSLLHTQTKQNKSCILDKPHSIKCNCKPPTR